MAFNMGPVENAKPSSKVLRPPGGGSSDIFGSQTPSTPRSMRNHMASNIFGSTQDASVKNSGDNARRGVKNGDSHSRLFGEANRSLTPAKNHMKNSIPLGGPETKVTDGNSTASSVPTPTNGHADGKNGKVENNNSLGGDLHQNGVSKPVGNPVTGEGYIISSEIPGGAEITTSVSSLNGARQVTSKHHIPLDGHLSRSR